MSGYEKLTVSDVQNAITYMSMAMPGLDGANAEFWYDVLKDAEVSGKTLMRVAREYVKSAARFAPTVGQVYEKLAAIKEPEPHSGPSGGELRRGIARLIKAGRRPITDVYGAATLFSGVPLWLKYDTDIKKTECIMVKNGDRTRFISKSMFTQEVLDYETPGTYQKCLKMRNDSSFMEFGRLISEIDRVKMVGDKLFNRAMRVYLSDRSEWCARLAPVMSRKDSTDESFSKF